MMGCLTTGGEIVQPAQSVQYLGFRLVPSYAQFVQFLTSYAIAAVCFNDLMA
jgi:hypothetical protein